MHYYHDNLLPPLLFNLFFHKQSNSWLYGRTANNYREHHCWTNLKKIHNYLPRSKVLELPSCYNHFFVKFYQF